MQGELNTIPFDYVICRVCGAHVKKSMVGKGGHLAVKHAMSVQEYRAAYPDAILYSQRRIALEKARRQQRPELVRARSKRWREKNPETVKINIENWRAKNPDKVKAQKQRSARKYATRRRMLWASRTPEQFEEDRRNARAAYALRYPNRSPEKIEKDSDRSRAKYQERQAKVKFAATFPADWWHDKHDSKKDWRSVGSELLSREGYMSNEELAERLNAARVLRCPFCKEGDWGCITRTGPEMNYIAKIRKWVNRPGRAPVRK